MPDDCVDFQLNVDVIEPIKDVAGVTSENLNVFYSGESDNAIPMAKAHATMKIIRKIIGKKGLFEI